MSGVFEKLRLTLLSAYVPGFCVAPRLQSCDLFDRHFITLSNPQLAVQPAGTGP